MAFLLPESENRGSHFPYKSTLALQAIDLRARPWAR